MSEACLRLPSSPTIFLQTSQSHGLAGSMIYGHLHVEVRARVSQILCSQDSAFLTNEKGSLQYHVSLSKIEVLGYEVLTLKVLHPTLPGQMERSETFRFLTP